MSKNVEKGIAGGSGMLYNKFTYDKLTYKTDDVSDW